MVYEKGGLSLDALIDRDRGLKGYVKKGGGESASRLA